MLKRIAALFTKRKDNPPKVDTCEYCKHLYFNNDGSAACDSPFYKYCLFGGVRLYKEPINSNSVEQKIGTWILQPSNKEQGERDFIWWKCSECGHVIYSETDRDRREFHRFCSRCGAKMS